MGEPSRETGMRPGFAGHVGEEEGVGLGGKCGPPPQDNAVEDTRRGVEDLLRKVVAAPTA